MLGSALLVGVFGGVHCVVMCGGIVNSLNFAMVTGQRSGARHLLLLLLFNVGRVASYALIGALAGGLAGWLHIHAGWLMTVSRVAAGTVVIAMGLYLSGWWRGLALLERVGERLVWRHIQPLVRLVIPVDRPWRAVLLGSLWGWLPCGLVYSALVVAAASGHWVLGASIMVSFGAGTLPIMMLVGGLAEPLRRWVSRAGTRTAAACLVMGFGLWILTAPVMQLWHPQHLPAQPSEGPPHHSSVTD